MTRHFRSGFIFGDRYANNLEGTDWSDLIFGFGGDDVIDAGAGNDIIFAGRGNDRIRAGAGNDVINGGQGFDTAEYDGSIFEYDVARLGGWFSTTAIVTRSGSDGAPVEVDYLHGVEALHFEAEDYTLYLDGRNNQVLAQDDAAATDEDTALHLSAADLLANDTDFDGDTLAITGVDAQSALGAAISFLDGEIVYDPAGSFDALKEGETVIDTFVYTVDDGRGGEATATVSITVTGRNDAPVLELAASTDYAENGTDAVITAAASDVDSDSFIFSLEGTDADLFTIDAVSGEIRFKSSPDFEMPADQNGDNAYELEVIATDAEGASSRQDLTVNVTDVEETPQADARINEIHYDNASTDTGEFVEIRVNADADITGLQVQLINGTGGEAYNSADLSTLTKTSDGTYDYYVWNLPANGIQNGSPDGVALIDGDEVAEFLSYEGTFDGTINGQTVTSTDIGVSESGSTPAGFSLQRNDDGTWNSAAAETKGAANSSDTGGDPTARFISEIQGTGSASLLVGDYVLVSAVVTYTTGNGFFLQEEDSDADGDALTSEGIFVFTGGAPAVTAGDTVEVAGTVEEFFGLTQLGDVTDITRTGTTTLPTAAGIQLSQTATNFEQYEGMRISVTSGIQDEALTVIENFNLDAFGDITISAGTQTQATQLYDAQTQSDEIADHTEGNMNNRLGITDGSSARNPDSYSYIANDTSGDNGDGILSRGDVIGEDGPTLRLGAELNGALEGVLTYEFGEYKALVDGTLDIDESTNTGAREDAPADVGGDLQVASFNVLNYFTTFSGGTGPNGDLDPRGADNQEQFDRQTAKIVDAMIKTGAEVFALQEIENNGFGDASAIAALVDALNAEALAEGTGAVYAYVNPLGEDGFLGTDAIMTGMVYDTTKLSLVHADVLSFEETSAADTYAIAEILNPYVSSSDRVGDFQRNRPATVATFQDADGEVFTVASNHFKSKGDSNLQDLAEGVQAALDAGSVPADEVDTVEAALAALLADPNYDQGNGQGFWNQVRADAASELTDWLESTYADALADLGITDADYLLLGDFNAYAMEDPVQAVRDGAGYKDLIDQFIGQQDAYSFVFDGQQGTLDQALASEGLAGQVTGLTEWHINADEPDLFNYRDEDFYNDDPFAASDHDPVILGLDLGPQNDALLA